MIRNILTYQRNIITSSNKNYFFENSGFYKLVEKSFVDYRKMAVMTRKIRKGI